jgi:hypothetical protein
MQCKCTCKLNTYGVTMKPQIPIGATKGNYCIQYPGGHIYTKEMVENVPIELVGSTFPTNLLVLKGQDKDVILGMN